LTGASGWARNFIQKHDWSLSLQTLALDAGGAVPSKILCLGAHCDDIEIGCGGTIIKLLESNPGTVVYWVVFSSDQQRQEEARLSACAFLKSSNTKTVIIKEFRNGFFPYIGAEIKEYFEEIKAQFHPDVIFTHYRNDLHQDHRLISDLTWNSFRNHLILEYEIPKYDGDLGTPNLFVHLTDSVVDRKVNYILESFHSQREKQWFDPETFRAILRLRGIESQSTTKYAEAFYCRKIVLQ
jgi:LmbE family N-acetylglucosaminyl deacetylase